MPPQVLDVTQSPYNAVAGTDATAAIQAALNDAATLSATNDVTVYIPPGEYFLSPNPPSSQRALILPGPVTLAGAGPTTILKAYDRFGGVEAGKTFSFVTEGNYNQTNNSTQVTGSFDGAVQNYALAPHFQMLSLEHVKNACVRDLTLDGNKGRNPWAGDSFDLFGVLRLYDCDDVVVRNVRVHDSPANAVTVLESRGCVFDGCTLLRSGCHPNRFGDGLGASAGGVHVHSLGLYANGCHDLLFVRTESSDNDRYGFALHNSYRCAFVECVALNNAGPGFGLGGEGNRLVRCVSVGRRNGIHLNGNGTPPAGVPHGNHAVRCRVVVVNDDAFGAADYSPIRVESPPVAGNVSRGTLVVGCSVTWRTLPVPSRIAAVHIDKDCEGVVIADNDIATNTRAGIYTDGTATVLVDNRIECFGQHAVYVDRPNCEVIGNVAARPSEPGYAAVLAKVESEPLGLRVKANDFGSAVGVDLEGGPHQVVGNRFGLADGPQGVPAVWIRSEAEVVDNHLVAGEQVRIQAGAVLTNALHGGSVQWTGTPPGPERGNT